MKETWTELPIPLSLQPGAHGAADMAWDRDGMRVAYARNHGHAHPAGVIGLEPSSGQTWQWQFPAGGRLVQHDAHDGWLAVHAGGLYLLRWQEPARLLFPFSLPSGWRAAMLARHQPGPPWMVVMQPPDQQGARLLCLDSQPRLLGRWDLSNWQSGCLAGDGPGCWWTVVNDEGTSLVRIGTHQAPEATFVRFDEPILTLASHPPSGSLVAGGSKQGYLVSQALDTELRFAVPESLQGLWWVDGLQVMGAGQEEIVLWQHGPRSMERLWTKVLTDAALCSAWHPSGGLMVLFREHLGWVGQMR